MTVPVAITVQYSGTSVAIDFGSTITGVDQGLPLTVTIAGTAYTLGEQINQNTWGLWPFPGGVVASPGDAVTVTIPAGALTESAGAVTAGTYTAVNGSGVPQLPDVPAGTKAMRVGYNVESGYYYQPAALYSNQARFSAGFSGTTVDTLGYPDPAGGGGIGTICITPSPAGPYTSYPLAPPGTWFVMWDGASADFYINAATQIGGVTGQATDNWKSFSVSNVSGELCPNVNCVFNYGSGAASNLRVFPADPEITGPGPGPPSNPPKFWPAMVRKLASAQLIRAKDLQQTDGGVTAVDYGELPAQSWATFLQSTASVGVSRFDSCTSGPFALPSTTFLLITTSSPHPFKNGQTVSFSGGPPGQTYNVTFSDSSSGAFSTASAFPAWVVSSTQFVFQTSVFGTGAGLPFTGFDATNGESVHLHLAGVPPEDCAELAALTPGQELWYNVPIICSDASITQQAETILVSYPDRPLYLEVGNEPWNTALGFVQVDLYCRTFGQNMTAPKGPLDVGSSFGNNTYVYLAANAHRLFRAAWTAAGRDPNQVRLLLNLNITQSVAFVSEYITYAATHDWFGYPNTDPGYSGTPIDVFAIAGTGYWALAAGSTTACDALTLEQLMDWGDVVMGPDPNNPGFSRFRTVWTIQSILNTRTLMDNAIAATGYPHPIEIVNYEGGPTGNGMGGTTSLYNDKVIGWCFHPRARNQTLHALQALNDADVYAHCRLGLSSFFSNENGQLRSYGTYQGPQQLAGRGDGTDGLFNNFALPLADPTTKLAVTAPDLTNLVSVVGDAYDAWSAAPGALAAGTLTSGVVTSSSVALSLAINSGGTTPYSNQLQRSPHGAGTWVDQGSPVAGATPSFTDATVAASTQYDYRVIVTDSATPTAATATSNTVTVTTSAPAVPLVAGTLTSGVVTSSSVALTLATNSGGTTPYSSQLQRSPHGAGTWADIGSPVAGAAPGFVDSTVAASTSYDYRVTVTDSATPTAATATSNTVTVTTGAAPGPGGYVVLQAGGGYLALQAG